MSKIDPCFVLQEFCQGAAGTWSGPYLVPSLPLSMQITGIDEGLTVKQVCIDFLDKVFLLTYERGSKTVSL